jgi:hypothetical protein
VDIEFYTNYEQKITLVIKLRKLCNIIIIYEIK